MYFERITNGKTRRGSMHVRFQSPSSGVLESNPKTSTLKSSVDTFSIGTGYTLIDVLDPSTILIIFISLRVTLTRRCNDSALDIMPDIISKLVRTYKSDWFQPMIFIHMLLLQLIFFNVRTRKRP